MALLDHPKSKLWHCWPPDEVLERLGASANGLTSADARKLLAEHGPNALKEAKPISPWAIFFAQFKSVVIWVLIGAGALSGMLGEAIDAIAIFAIVILNAVVGFYQEFSAEKSVAALMRMTAPQAKVRRDGAVTTVVSTDIAPGDILELEPGDVVAADARLLNASSLKCVEAMLTGESEAVAKAAETLDQPELPLGDRKNIIFMGTSVAAGSGRAIVVATRMQTEIGGIATLIGDAGKDKETPLQRKLEAFGRILLSFGFFSLNRCFGGGGSLGLWFLGDDRSGRDLAPPWRIGFGAPLFRSSALEGKTLRECCTSHRIDDDFVCDMRRRDARSCLRTTDLFDTGS
jgi:Ca2+-transporting ATPase